MVRLMLEQSGYEVLEAPDGSDALKILQNKPGAIDLVLTDVTMPRMSGPELAARISRERPGLRILFMSGYSDEPAVQQIERCSTLFIAKPFTADALEAKVREALRRPWTGVRKSGPGFEPR
jgi:two-component system, cell cycle sensor histidine kinase and response regulator CckA